MRPVVIRMAAPAMCGRAIGAVTRPHVDRFDRSRRIVHPRRAVSRCVRASSSSSSNPWQGPPPGRLDETAARDRVMQLASGTPQGQGALEAVQGCVSVMPGMTNNRVMLFRYPGCKSPLDTVALPACWAARRTPGMLQLLLALRLPKLLLGVLHGVLALD